MFSNYYEEIRNDILKNSHIEHNKIKTTPKNDKLLKIGKILYFKDSGLLWEGRIVEIGSYSVEAEIKKPNGVKQKEVAYSSDFGSRVFFNKADANLGLSELKKDRRYSSLINESNIDSTVEWLRKKSEPYMPPNPMGEEYKQRIINSYSKPDPEDKEYRDGCYSCFGRMDFDTSLMPYGEEFEDHYYTKVYIADTYERPFGKRIWNHGEPVWQIAAGLYFRPRIDDIHSGVNLSYYVDTGIVIDWRTDLAGLYYDTTITSFEKKAPDGFKYKHNMMLKRRLEKDNPVDLFRLTSVGSKDTISFDPFLAKILEERKNNYELKNIIQTIQDNQNRIIRYPGLETSISVCGCAGSGKTMVLLHRLSVLMYKNPDVPSTQYEIITPSSVFDAHIDELSKQIQLQNVRRRTPEEMYLDILATYDTSFVSQTLNTQDSSFDNRVVSYIYSDDFIKDIDSSMSSVKQDIIKSAAILLDIQTIKNIANLYSISYEVPKFQLNDSNGLQSAISYCESVMLALQVCKKLLTLYGDLINNARNDRKAIDSIFTRRIGKLNSTNLTYFDSDDIICLTKILLDRLNELNESQRNERELKYHPLYGRIRRITANVPVVYVRGIIQELELDSKTLQDLYVRRKKTTPNSSEKLSYRERLEKAKNKAIQLGINNPDICLKRGIAYANNDYDIVYNMLTACKEIQKKPKYKSLFDKYYPIILNNKFLGYSENNVSRHKLYAEALFCERITNSMASAERPKSVRAAIGKYLFIDECQDFSLNELKLIDRFNELKTVFNVFGDVEQLIKIGYGISNWSDLKKLRSNIEEYEIMENYRNTQNIVNYCNHVFERQSKPIGFSGDDVRKIGIDLAIKEISRIISSITKKRIAIIVHSMADIFAEKIRTKFLDKIAINDVINGRISLISVEYAKGLEFNDVYVYDENMTRNEKYISYTRALNRLTIIEEDTIDDLLF